MQRKRISHKKNRIYGCIAGVFCLLCVAAVTAMAFQHYAGKEAGSVQTIANNQELSLEERVEKIVD